MRYISPIQEYTIFSNSGKRVLHKFFNGALVVGDPTVDTTAADKIDFAENTDKDLEVNLVKTFDFAGKKLGDSGVSRPELAGLGYLGDTVAKSDGLFFEAPIKTVFLANFEVGDWVEIIAGTATAGGVTYSAGQIVEVTAAMIEDDPAPTYSAGFQCAITFARNKCGCFLAEYYKQANLMQGDEPLTYFNWVTGFEPRNSMLTTDIGTTGFGWIR